MARTSMKRLYWSYITGFGLSLLLTMVAYVFTTIYQGQAHRIDGTPEFSAVAVLVGLAVIQLIAQVVFFLHLGREAKPRWNTAAFLFMGMVVLIIGIGSLWIMYNLNYNMPSEEVETFIMRDENIKPSDSMKHE